MLYAQFCRGMPLQSTHFGTRCASRRFATVWRGWLFSVVAVIYDLLKIVLQLSFKPDHAKVVYDKQVMCVELAEEVGLSSFEMYEFEVLDEHVHSDV